MKYLIPVFSICIFYLLVSCNHFQNKSFVLVSDNHVKKVFISENEPFYVQLAVDDFLNDVEKISGKRLEQVSDFSQCLEGCVVIGTVNKNTYEFFNGISEHTEELLGKWEAYKIKTVEDHLLIVGSDERGTMFGIYDFISTYLEVDPLYFWTDKEPEPKEVLSWDKVNIDQKTPTFKYRGWFINDEDLLTDWKVGNGSRNIDYPFYSTVVSKEILERVVEAMLRLRFNLIIPASFIDIANPAEKDLVDIASRRGVFLSMHHIEPLGVSAFSYFNYWNERGKDLKFSYFSHPNELKEVWRFYAEKWAKVPNVIWQVGLRGIADKPMWLADDAIPESDSARGALISSAMDEQIRIIKSVDSRPEIPFTTTLWMEGSELNEKGYLTFPTEVSVIFSDNSPGWMMQADFFQTKRELSRGYGIYYHHQLWGTGPHLAQGVPPSKTYEILGQAVSYKSNDYAMFNVSNIREFVLGIEATSEMLYNYQLFDPDVFLEKWCENRFGLASIDAEKSYRKYFDSFQMHEVSNGPVLLDGQIKRKGLSLLNVIESQIKSPSKVFNEDPKQVDDFSWLDPYLRDSRMGDISFLTLNEMIRTQKEKFFETNIFALDAADQMNSKQRLFFESNLISHTMIMHGLSVWLEEISKAVIASSNDNYEECTIHLKNALNAFDIIKKGQNLNVVGEKWSNWYAGELKMNLRGMENKTSEIYKVSESMILGEKL